MVEDVRQLGGEGVSHGGIVGEGEVTHDNAEQWE
jgi:hypothetical protein